LAPGRLDFADENGCEGVTASDVIPPDLKEFLRRSIKSVWALELLLLVRKSGEQSWNVDQLATELRASHAVVQGVLPQLISDGLVAEVESGLFRFEPATDALRNNVDRLDVIYHANPVTLIREIVLAPNPKIQSFADAFKFRKE
jgi:hypothetical protein